MKKIKLMCLCIAIFGLASTGIVFADSGKHYYGGSKHYYVGENILSISNRIRTIKIIIVVVGILAEATTVEEGTTVVASIGVMEDMVSG